MSDYNSAKQNRSNKFCNKADKKYLKMAEKRQFGIFFGCGLLCPSSSLDE